MATESSISVMVRVRPFNEKEKIRCGSQGNESSPVQGNWSLRQPQVIGAANRKIVEVVDERMLVFDPQNQSVQSNAPKAMTGRIREQKFIFDRVFDQNSSQEEVYASTVKPLLDTVLEGFNASVFAYGATGCGKTHTISGTPDQQGIIFLAMEDLFNRIESLRDTKEVTLSLSYLEIYNETLRDLLSDKQANLALREGSDKRMHVSNLTSHLPTSVAEVMDLIFKGNEKRTISPTEANSVSSRSHAVLEIAVTVNDKLQGLQEQKSCSSLTIIDLAGSERAASTRNSGLRLVEGANINRSLLALGNCINGLCDARRRSHIPYRDSKLTRLLKFSLGGNCKTVMIACIAPSSSHYDETLNTLKYADRAKSIKTKVSRNLLTVDRHVQSYCRKISQQQEDIAALREELAKLKATDLSGSQNKVPVEDAIRQIEALSVELAPRRIEYATALRKKRTLYNRYERIQSIWRKLCLYAPENCVLSVNSEIEAKLAELHAEYAQYENVTLDNSLTNAIEQARKNLELRCIDTDLFDASCRAIESENENQIAKLANELAIDTSTEEFLLELLADLGILHKPVSSASIETPSKRFRIDEAHMGESKLRSLGKRLRYGDVPPQSPLERDISMQDLVSPTGSNSHYLSRP